MNWTKVGEGMNASYSEAYIEGTLREIRTPNDSLSILENPPSNLVILLKTAGVTAISPIISMVNAVICTTGGTSSHLAIVSREFKIPCIMGARISTRVRLDGQPVLIRTNKKRGYIYTHEEE